MSTDYPDTAGACYIERSQIDYVDPPLLLDAETAANFVASLISSFTGSEVDGDGDAWTIVCEHLATLLGNLSAALHRPEGEPVSDHLFHEYGLDPNDLRTDDEKARDELAEECPDVEMTILASGTVEELPAPGIEDIAWFESTVDLFPGQRVALIAIPDSIEVLPS